MVKKSAEHGSMEAQNSLAYFYLNGLGGLPLDKNQAITLVKKSAEQGWPEAQENLAIAYENGMGELPRNYKQAYAWYSVAYINGKDDAGKLRDNIASKLTEKELLQARNMAEAYMYHYSASHDVMLLNN
ncbi:sel1 repeat family protein [Salmonella enterica subsp. enterica]|nr:sel1 repeat family protein [Salmonella enterica subsp. enterica serovar Canada]EDS5958571.1 sel1 repeat family protein [Salmonella enterica subsp. enterica]EDS6426619.1 sel1 repeat family protein [Salmonella enterica subsp. enterica]EDY4903329.1 sel1 repeat family protein [Salmonella enterica]EDZ0486953.1 sel1 repeat family protein [Salmonella enterica]